MKKLISSLLIFAVLICNISAFASAECLKTYKYKGFSYSFIGSKAVFITGYSGNKTKLNIPKKIKGNTVKSVEPYGMKNFKNVKSIHFPNGVTICTLSNAHQLKKITVNKSNKRYSVKNNLVLNKKGNKVLICPGGIKNVKIPDSVKIIDVTAFNSVNIKTVKLGKKVETIDSSAFNNCDKLKEIVFNNNLKTIEYDAFSWCISLKRVSFPNGLEVIGDEAFKHCTALEKVTIPSSVKSIGAGAFEECEKLSSVYIYSKDCEILTGEYDEYYKKYLSVTIPKSATIYGYKDSTAEKYAKKNGNRFIEL